MSYLLRLFSFAEDNHRHSLLTRAHCPGRRWPKILKGEADAIAFNGIDRWIGGVHLEQHRCPWRWGDVDQQVIRAPL
jgi:mono/diheme cytochrome c family protein